MRIKKMYQGTAPENKILNQYSTSQTDTYSCNYTNKLVEFSTTEKVVGKWIDGKPLYQKTFSGNLTLGSGTTISDLTPLNYSFISFYDVTFTKVQTSNSTRYWFPVFYESSTDYARIYIRESDRLLIALVKGSAVNELKAYVTLRYTKTTD